MAIEVHSLSYSTVRQYTGECPERVFLDKVDHQPKRGVSANALLGSGIHAAAEAYFRGLLLGRKVEVEVLHRVFASRWEQAPQDELIFTANKEKDDLFAKARQLLQLLVEMEPPHQILAVERPVKYQLTNDLAVVGVPDLVCRDKNGLVIYDIKTSARVLGQAEKHAAALQMFGYAMAFPEAARLRARVFVKKKEPTVEDIELDPNSVDFDEWRTKFVMAKRGIEAGIRYRNRGWYCKTCAYNYICCERDAPVYAEEEREAA